MTDEELVDRVVAGSEAACRELVERFQRPIYNLIRRMVRDPSVAEELAQEVFVKALQALPGYDRSRKLSSWLFKIAHNATIDHLRRRRLETVSLESGPDEVSLLDTLHNHTARTPQAVREQSELRTALEGAIAALRPEYREVILLRFKEGMSYQEIADVTGLPMGTVKIHLHRARKEMVAALAELGWGRRNRR